MSKYVYTSPVENGYVRIKLTRKEHEKIFKRKPSRITKREYYKRNNEILVHYFDPLWIVVLNIILYPFLLLMCGLSNIKELNRDIGRSFNQKQGGHFYSDHKYLNKGSEI